MRNTIAKPSNHVNYGVSAMIVFAAAIVFFVFNIIYRAFIG